MVGKTVQLKSPLIDNAIRAGEFELLPTNPVPPFINSQPIKNLNQYTWVTSIKDGVPQYQQITPSFNIVRMLQGTAFSFQVRVSDPAQVNDNSDLSDISYKWKKDEGLIYNVNSLNGGTGIAGILIDSSSCTPLISGQYTCEVSNQYGSVETDPLEIEVIDPINYPKLFTNLIANSDGDGGLSGWQADPNIVTSPFTKDLFVAFRSFRLGGFATFTEDTSSAEPTSIPKTFRFGQSSNDILFYKKYIERYQIDPLFRNTRTPADPYIQNSADRWLTTSILPQIVANEDYNRSTFGGFFPGIAWMDLYNKNNNTKLIGLLPEFSNTTTTYFGRGPIKFQRYGGKSTVLMTQTVSVEDVADMVDGSVYGVQYLTSQFFAYVGAGITDYKIKVQTSLGERTLNYYVADSEQVYNRIIDKPNGLFPSVNGSELGTPQSRIKLTPNSDIEIIPLCYDKTTITLTYLDSSGRELKSETIDGPTERDVWAIKEKTYFPATLYGLFEFIEPSNNTIKVFGQKYTDTNALSTFFRPNEFGLFGKPHHKAGDTVPLPSGIADKAVIQLLTKYDWREFKSPYPGNFYYAQNQTKNFFDKALPDYGAAAMFGVGRDIIIPKRTRSIKVQVTFTHESEMFYDTDPKLKSWKSEELYANEYGLTDPTSYRLTEYGTPRCGITKMKLILAPNNIEISDKYLTYSLPPESSTVLGLQKNKYNIQDAFNTADATQFTYDFVQPADVPPTPPNTSVFVNADVVAAYTAGAQQLVSQETQNSDQAVVDIDQNTLQILSGSIDAVS